MHAGQARLVVIEMSGPDSLSDAVRRQVHFGRTHPEYQLTKALGVHRGATAAQKQQLCRPPNAHKCCLCSCVAPSDLFVSIKGCGLHTTASVFLEGDGPYFL